MIHSVRLGEFFNELAIAIYCRISLKEKSIFGSSSNVVSSGVTVRKKCSINSKTKLGIPKVI